MFKPRILLCGPGGGSRESAESLETLCLLPTLPNSERFLVTTGKFDSKGLAKNFNVDAGYPHEPPYLQTLAAWANLNSHSDPRFRDGYDLFCLIKILAKNIGFDLAILLRDATQLEERLSSLLKAAEGNLFLTFDGTGSTTNAKDSKLNLLINLRDTRASEFLDLSWELYSTGAAYSIEPYSLDRALMAAADGLSLSAEILEN